MDEINITVSKVRGGYIINHTEGMFVETDLNKVIFFIRNQLNREFEVPVLEL